MLTETGLVCLIGPPGAGKTTTTRVLAQLSGVRPLYEPIGRASFLPAFIADRPRWAFHNQVDFILRTAQASQKASSLLLEGYEVYQDGGLLSCHFHSSFYHRMGWLTRPEFSICSSLISALRKALPVTTTIVLTAKTEILIHRVQNRSNHPMPVRSNEELITQIEAWKTWYRSRRFAAFDTSQLLPDEVAKHVRDSIRATK